MFNIRHKTSTHLLKARVIQGGIPTYRAQSSNNKENYKNGRWHYPPLVALMGLSLFTIAKQRAVDAESKQDGEPKNDQEQTFFQRNVIDYKQVARDNFKIPHMLMEREKQKQAEYKTRKDVDIEELGMNPTELATMKELDYMYGGSTTQQELADMEEEEN